MLGFTTSAGEKLSPTTTKAGIAVPLPCGGFKTFVGCFHEIKARIFLALCAYESRVDDIPGVIEDAEVFERFVRPMRSTGASQTFHFLGLEIILTDLVSDRLYLEVRPVGARLGTTLVCEDPYDGYRVLHRILNSQWAAAHIRQLS